MYFYYLFEYYIYIGMDINHTPPNRRITLVRMDNYKLIICLSINYSTYNKVGSYWASGD